MIHNNKISSGQLTTLIFCAFIGFYSVAAPYFALNECGTAGYISILIGGTAAALLNALIVQMDTGKHKSKFSDIVDLIYSVLVSSYTLLTAGKIASNLKGENVFAAITFIIMVVSFYCAVKGTQTMVRASQIIFVLFIIFFVIIFAVNTDSKEIYRLIPVDEEKSRLLRSSFRMFGLFLPLGFLLKYGNDADGCKAKSVFAAIILITLVITIGTALSIKAYGINEAQRKIYPFIKLMNYTEFKGSFIEKQEFIMTCIYLFSAFFMVGIGINYAKESFESLYNKNVNSAVTAFISLLIFGISIAFKNSGLHLEYGIIKTNTFFINIFATNAIISFFRRDKK